MYICNMSLHMICLAKERKQKKGRLSPRMNFAPTSRIKYRRQYKLGFFFLFYPVRFKKQFIIVLLPGRQITYIQIFYGKIHSQISSLKGTNGKHKISIITQKFFEYALVFARQCKQILKHFSHFVLFLFLLIKI